MEPENRKTIILIRHGRTEYNTLGKYMGRGVDIGLSPEGIREIEEKRDRVRDVSEGAVIFTGPLLRAKDTAKLVFFDRDINVCDSLTEIDFGDFEGKSAAELGDDPRYQQWIDSDGTLQFPNGESIEEFRARTMDSLHNIIQTAGNEPKIAIVCHGGCIMAIMSGLCGGKYHDYLIPNLDGYILQMTVEDERISDITYDRIGSGDRT